MMSQKESRVYPDHTSSRKQPHPWHDWSVLTTSYDAQYEAPKLGPIGHPSFLIPRANELQINRIWIRIALKRVSLWGCHQKDFDRKPTWRRVNLHHQSHLFVSDKNLPFVLRGLIQIWFEVNLIKELGSSYVDIDKWDMKSNGTFLYANFICFCPNNMF